MENSPGQRPTRSMFAAQWVRLSIASFISDMPIMFYKSSYLDLCKANIGDLLPVRTENDIWYDKSR